MVERSGLVILLAAERSGTHMFRSIMQRNGVAYAPGEVANAGVAVDEDQITNFFAFRQRFAEQFGGVFVPSTANTEKLLDAFFDLFSTQGGQRGRKFAICDIKYAHIVNFVGGWWDMLSPPFLFDWARRNNVPIIHLVRRAVAETCLSNMYAQKTGVWRTRRSDEVQTLTMSVDRAVLKKDMDRLTGVVDAIRNWSSACNPTEIYYEELLDTDSQSWADVRQLLDSPIDKIVSDFVKTTPPYEEVVTNLEEVRDLFETRIDKAPRRTA